MKVIDESGEDYLYPQEMFSFIKLPPWISEKIDKEYRLRKI